MSNYNHKKKYVSAEDIAIKKYDTPENREKFEDYVEKFSEAIESNINSVSVPISTSVLRSMLDSKVGQLKWTYNKDRKQADLIIDDIVNYSLKLKVPSRSIGRLINTAIKGAEK